MNQPLRFYSNSLQILAQQLGKRLFDPSSRPFDKRLVIVPSSAMKDFLLHYFAASPQWSIFAGVRILPLGEGFLEIQSFLNREKTSRIPSRLELSLRIEQIIYQWIENESQFDPKELQIVKPFLHYFETANGPLEKKTGALAAHLSSLFLRYGIFGSNFLPTWLEQRGWQQKIFQQIYSDHSGWTYPIQALQRKTPLDFQPHLFGFSTLPKIYLEFFHRLNAAIYTLSPSAMFWEDLLTDRERIGSRRYFEKQKVNQKDLVAWEEYVRNTNPLLANWGKAGREFRKILDETDCITDEEYLEPQAELQATSLSYLKKNILYLNPHDALQQQSADPSVQIHSAPSLLREIEILYDQLALLMHENLMLEPKEVLVLAPDLEVYVPFIETVFGNEESMFSFSLEGVSDPAAKEFVEGILHLIALPTLHYSAEAVIQLFSFPTFCKKWEISSEDATVMKRLIQHANVRFGTWEQGFDRLALGLVMKLDDDHLDLDVLDGLWPCKEVEISHIEQLKKLIGLIQSLKKDLIPVEIGQKKSFFSWLDWLQKIVDVYFQVEEEDFFLLKNVTNWRMFFPKDDLAETPVPISMLIRSIEAMAQTQTISRSAHNMQKITFRPLKSGNVTESKVIWLLGMDEMSFPRVDSFSSLCAMKEHSDWHSVPKQADEDRYLLLESLTLAKEHLIFSYQRQDPEDNKQMGPSLMIQELLQYIPIPVQNHPILSFDSRYFSSDSPLASASQRHFMNAQQFYGMKTQPDPFIQNRSDFCSDGLKETISIKELTDLARNPIRFHFQQALQIYLRSEEDDAKDFHLSALLRSVFRKQLLAKSCDLQRTLEKQVKIWDMEGKLPVGVFGKAAIKTVQEEIADLKNHLESFNVDLKQIFSVEFSAVCTQPTLLNEMKWILPAISVPTSLEKSVQIIGTIDLMTPYGLLHHAEDRLSDWVKCWPQILVLNCLKDPPFSFQKKLLLTKSGTMKEAAFSNAESLLSSYVAYYKKALEIFSPIHPDWIASLLEGSQEDLEKSILKSLNSEQIEDLHLQYLKRRDALAPLCQNYDEWSALAKSLFKPMLDAWKKEKADAAF